jgi:carbon-monoxide dehydrogenase large subunit
MAGALVGRGLKRREDFRFLTGQGAYTGDLKADRLAHAVLVRSPYAHAAVTQVDAEAARGLPGVVAVFTAADLAADGVPDMPGGVDLPRSDGELSPRTGRPLLARDRVRHVGEPVALVLGRTVEDAMAAAEAVAVSYDELPPVATVADTRTADAPAVWSQAPDNVAFVWRGGDVAAVEKALGAADHVTRLALSISRVTAASIEPRISLAATDETGRLVLHTSHQGPHELHGALVRLLALDPQRLRVVSTDVGGSFGMKAGLYPETALTVWAARRTGLPVRWASDRAEAFLSDEHGRDIEAEVELGLDRDGHFTALRVRYHANVGAYLSGRSLAPVNNIGGIAGVYRTPYVCAEIRGVFTNTVPLGPYRGAGRPEATYAIERAIDVAARELGIEPFELRRRNLVPPEAMPYKTGFLFTYDCGDFGANMTAAARLADLEGFAQRRAEAATRGRLRGIGIANPVEVSGGPYFRIGKDAARLTIAPDGVITIDVGAMSTGQGLETAMPQLVADRLGIPAERVRFRQGDTDYLVYGRGSGGSSALCVGGAAVSVATDRVLEKARLIAAEALEVAVADVEFAEARFRIVGTDRSIGLSEVAALAAEPDRLPAGMAPGLSELAEFQPPGVTFPNGCHICEIEIDPETGVVELIAYSAVEDVGRVLNPMLVRGQVHGGVAQAVGQALGEQIVHDRTTAQLLTGSFMDYAMPRATDLPEIRLETREVPTAVNPLGAKGVGEAGTVGGLAATLNAICDALAPLGIGHIDMPATPQRVWAAIDACRSRR